MSKILYDNYNEKGIFMKKNIELDKQYAEPQQMNTKIEADPTCEVTMALDILGKKIYVAHEAIDDLKARLYPILPPESKNEDINFIEDNQTEFSCPLAKEIELYYCRISEITDTIRYLLKNIKL